MACCGGGSGTGAVGSACSQWQDLVGCLSVRSIAGTSVPLHLLQSLPQVMEQQHGYNEKADIWSLGITALELLKGYAPYSKYAPMQVLIKTIREPPPSIRSYVDPPGSAAAPPSDKFNKFVARCLQKDPRLRFVRAGGRA